jgi:hypothetical protein
MEEKILNDLVLWVWERSWREGGGMLKGGFEVGCERGDEGGMIRMMKAKRKVTAILYLRKRKEQVCMSLCRGRGKMKEEILQ